jgi:hypothetical protein
LSCSFQFARHSGGGHIPATIHDQPEIWDRAKKYGYDARSQLTTQIEVSGATPLVTIVDGYDPVGTRITRNLDGNSITWTYDDLYRLTGQLKTGQVCTYTFDGDGTRRAALGGNLQLLVAINVSLFSTFLRLIGCCSSRLSAIIDR